MENVGFQKERFLATTLWTLVLWHWHINGKTSKTSLLTMYILLKVHFCGLVADSKSLTETSMIVMRCWMLSDKNRHDDTRGLWNLCGFWCKGAKTHCNLVPTSVLLINERLASCEKTQLSLIGVCLWHREMKDVWEHNKVSPSHSIVWHQCTSDLLKYLV